MPKKCPPGVFCIENATMFFIVVLIVGLCYYLFKLQIVVRLLLNKTIHNKKPNLVSSVLF